MITFCFQPSKYASLKKIATYRSSRPEVFLRKGFQKIFSKFTGEHSCRSAISINVQSNVFEIVLQHGCSPVNLLYIFRTPFLKNTSGWLLLNLQLMRWPVLFYLTRTRTTFVISYSSSKLQSYECKILSFHSYIHKSEQKLYYKTIGLLVIWSRNFLYKQKRQ